MEKYITTEDGGDGFGSQFFSRIAGITYADLNKLNWVHYPISRILMEDSPQSRNAELESANKLIDDIMINLKLKNINELDNSIRPIIYHRLHFYKEILYNPESYFNEELLKKIQDSYTKSPPDYYQNKKINIAIHIRRGNDIRVDDSVRYIDSDIYNKIINTLLDKFNESIIHIFSWNDPLINVQSSRIVYHITSDGGEEFISDFNALVHADILLVGSSTFSLSAGFFNKNKVLCSKDIFKLHSNTPFPPIWEKNFENIIGEI